MESYYTHLFIYLFIYLFIGLPSLTQHSYFEIHPSYLLLICFGGMSFSSTHSGQSISQ